MPLDQTYSLARFLLKAFLANLAIETNVSKKNNLAIFVQSMSLPPRIPAGHRHLGKEADTCDLSLSASSLSCCYAASGCISKIII